MIVACRAYGLRPIDGPFGDIKDPEGYVLAAKRAAALGCEGKWAIHPTQIALANEVFTPPAREIEKAKRILAALKEAAGTRQRRCCTRWPLNRRCFGENGNNVVK